MNLWINRIAGLVLANALLAGVPAAAGPAQVVLVRHAEKAAEPAADPGLSEAGQRRAEQLAAALAHGLPNAIVTSQFRRTRDTAAPVARVAGVEPVVVAAGRDLAGHVAAVVEAVRSAQGRVLVVGHSNTVPAIVGALGGPALPQLCETSHAQVLVLDLHGGTPVLQRWRYGAEDPPAADGCL